MAKISIQIYSENHKDVEKVYEAESYELFMGTIEDFMSVIDVDKLDNKQETFKAFVAGYDTLKPIFFEVFPEMTKEEFKRVKFTDLYKTVIQIGRAAVENLKLASKGGN